MEEKGSFSQFLPSRTSSTLNDETLPWNNNTDFYSDLSVVWTEAIARRETKAERAAERAASAKSVDMADLAETLPNSPEDRINKSFWTTDIINENNENNETLWMTALDITHNEIGQDGLEVLDNYINENSDDEMFEMNISDDETSLNDTLPMENG